MSDNNNRTKWLHLPQTPDEYDKIYRRYTGISCPKLSDYARSIMLNKPVISHCRNKSLDDFMTEMITLRNELTSIGNNSNQAVKRLHTLRQIAEFKSRITSYELETQTLFNKVAEIKNPLNKIADEWLQ